MKPETIDPSVSHKRVCEQATRSTVDEYNEYNSGMQKRCFRDLGGTECMLKFSKVHHLPTPATASDSYNQTMHRNTYFFRATFICRLCRLSRISHRATLLWHVFWIQSAISL